MRPPTQQTSALARLLAVVENYPQLKANEQFNRLMDELSGTENRIAVERMRYNERVQEYNTLRRRFPSNITATLFGFKEYPFFQAPAEAKQVPKVDFGRSRRARRRHTASAPWHTSAPSARRGVACDSGPASPYPLGATWDGTGVNFALFSEHATGVELCLFDSADAPTRVAAHPAARADRPWSGTATCPTCGPASSTATACTARTSRRTGHRFNPQQAAARPVRQGDRPRRCAGPTRCSATASATPSADLSFDDRDSAAFAPLAAVIDPAFTWGDDRPPRTPWHKTVIYELHVKGFTQLHPGVPETLRGTYAGLASEPAIEHLQELGVTAVELLPVHHHVDDRHLVERGLTQLLGLQHARLLRARHRATRVGATPRRRGARVQDDGARACTRPASR